MTDLILPRRQFLKTLSGIIAAPAIVRADSLMKVVAPQNDFESYISYFEWRYDGIVPVWRFIEEPLTVAPVTAAEREAPDMFQLLAYSPHPSGAGKSII